MNRPGGPMGSGTARRPAKCLWAPADELASVFWGRLESLGQSVPRGQRQATGLPAQMGGDIWVGTVAEMLRRPLIPLQQGSARGRRLVFTGPGCQGLDRTSY